MAWYSPMKILDWITQQLGNSEQSEAAWAPYLQREENSLTVFQNRCNAELIKVLFYFTDLKDDQRIEGDSDRYISGILPNTKIEYRIYGNAAQIGTYYFLDQQAFEAPELLIASFVRMAKESTKIGKNY
ncbi:hypothetical protein MNBD_GAMMA26-70 [hydrothermal vent metagenome]|uniref:Uncharacterized protein n=1 Tax=hydrothermal vent metagenome TaxID=652676 RepID=A0A3B1BZ92_9ZZZZ